MSSFKGIAPVKSECTVFADGVETFFFFLWQHKVCFSVHIAVCWLCGQCISIGQSCFNTGNHRHRVLVTEQRTREGMRGSVQEETGYRLAIFACMHGFDLLMQTYSKWCRCSSRPYSSPLSLTYQAGSK